MVEEQSLLFFLLSQLKSVCIQVYKQSLFFDTSLKAIIRVQFRFINTSVIFLQLSKNIFFYFLFYPQPDIPHMFPFDIIFAIDEKLTINKGNRETILFKIGTQLSKHLLVMRSAITFQFIQAYFQS